MAVVESVVVVVGAVGTGYKGSTAQTIVVLYICIVKIDGMAIKRSVSAESAKVMIISIAFSE